MTTRTTDLNPGDVGDQVAPARAPDDGVDQAGGFAASMRGLARPRVWILSAAAFVASAGVFFASSAPFAIPEVAAACGQQPPDMRFFTSADDLTGFLDACGPTGRNMYRNMQLADLIYPAVVAVFLASSLALAVRRLAPEGSKAFWLVSVPFVASSFDYLENSFAWFALARYPGSAPSDALLGFASAAKTVTSWASGIMLLGLLLALGAQFVRRRARHLHDDPSRSRSPGRRAASA